MTVPVSGPISQAVVIRREHVQMWEGSTMSALKPVAVGQTERLSDCSFTLRRLAKIRGLVRRVKYGAVIG